MHRLLWDNILQELMVAVLGSALQIPLVADIATLLIDRFIAEPLFEILTRWGVFISIDWKNEEIYSAYEKQAESIIDLQDKEEWNNEDRKRFKDAARALIQFNILK